MKKKQNDRILMVIKAMRDGCNDCPDRGLLCAVHLEIAVELELNPQVELPKLETEYFGVSYESQDNQSSDS